MKHASSMRVWLALGCLCVFGVTGWAVLAIWRRPATDSVTSVSAVPAVTTDRGFAGSSACKQCHLEQYESWHASYHRSMTQLPSPDTVLGDFDDVQLECDGQQCSLTRRGDEYWIKLPDPDWAQLRVQQGLPVTPHPDQPVVEKQVVMLTGSHNFQVYWVESELGNGLWEAPWAWSTADQEWFPALHTGINPAQPGQSLQILTPWNQICIMCHAVGGRPGFDWQQGQFATRVAELGIACEACHGPGQRHVDLQLGEEPVAAKANVRGSGAGGGYGRGVESNTASDAQIVNPQGLPAKLSAQVCGQCHSAFDPANSTQFWSDGLGFRAGEELAGTHRLIRFGDGDAQNALSFWQDGTCRVAGDEYTALIESSCFQQGDLSCISCHSMHQSDPTDQLAARMDGNQACLQCHTSIGERVEDHTHHPADSSGSLCYNCHMPLTSYGLLKAVRAHRIDSPDISRSVRTDRPNACNLCHLDQTFAWSGRYMREWYGAPEPALDEETREIAASVLWLTRGDAVQRAITAWHYGWEEAQRASGRQWQAPFLAALLQDPYAAVRYVAHRSLRTLPGFEDFPYTYYAPLNRLILARQRAIGTWAGHRGSTIPTAPGRLLLTPEGEFQSDRLEALLRDRDNRPIFIAE